MGLPVRLARHTMWWFFGGSLAAHALLIGLPSPQQYVPAVEMRTGPVLQLRVKEQNNAPLQAATTQTTTPSSPPQAERPRPPEPKPKPKPVVEENAPRLAEAVPALPKASAAEQITPEQAVEQIETPQQKLYDEHTEQEQLLAALNHELARHFHYPLQAVRRGWQGTVQLGFVVDEKGGIEYIQILQSSGHALLDRAAIQALSKVGNLAIHPRQARSLQLPVDYRLIEG